MPRNLSTASTTACMILVVTVIFTGTAAAQDRRGGWSPAESLTAEQEAVVLAILSEYDFSSLTVEDARTIHRAFKEAGLRKGPVLDDAMRSAGFDPHTLRELDPPGQRRRGDRADGGRRQDRNDSRREGGRGQNRYTLQQATSDRAQLTTIAFAGLAFMTGDLGSDSFIPPGKVADFFGFQHLRDVQSGGLGHNTSFLTRIANNMLFILDSTQKEKLKALARKQTGSIREFALKRFPLMKAFRRQLEGDIPAGSKGLDRAAVMEYSAELYELDGLLSYQRAQVMGSIISSLTKNQRASLDTLAAGEFNDWPEKRDQVDKRSMSHAEHVAVMTYASEMYSWYAGNVESDTYFCPERHGMYFGAFYMKAAPAMGNRNYTISTSLTGNSGDAFIDLLDTKQRPLITGLVSEQRRALNGIVETRRAISAELRRFIAGETADREKVLRLSRQYGEYDGELSYYYATRFAQVHATLSSRQKQALVKLRNLDDYPSRGAFLYSERTRMPRIMNTDFLFGVK